ncbi:hypothetical protein [Edaphobacter dinghuensis]|uniref:Transposase n=1 Tax=Edaphobacter dinghuensis TaxID=1560005 RepID=A0A917H987_9BACT|nr:hypothetical protein [Edaphobacter dinghuensis]GGG71606.1 hypothetical protein GCM10011585_12320 [Edaphobacter dinghuensis]
MTEPEKIDTTVPERQFHHAAHVPRTTPDSADFRVMELELENFRLQRLVAELLLKNQQLRKHKEEGEPDK